MNTIKTKKSNGELCSEKIAALLKKYNCTLICTPQKMYGQTVWVPVVDDMIDKK